MALQVRAVSPDSVALPIGGLWEIKVSVCGSPVVAPTVVVTLPGGTASNPAVEAIGGGCYRARYTVGTAGRYIARVSTADDAVNLAAYVTGTTSGSAMPTVTDVDAYLGTNSWTTEELQAALDAEAAAQRAVCRVGAEYPADLREALLRRVARNLALRRLPLAVLQGDAEMGSSTVLPGRDPEVRRLEAPHRKLVLG